MVAKAGAFPLILPWAPPPPEEVAEVFPRRLEGVEEFHWKET